MISSLRLGTLVRHRTGERGIVIPYPAVEAHGVSVLGLDEQDRPTVVHVGDRARFDRAWTPEPPVPPVGKIVIMADLEGVGGVPNEEAAVTPAEETGGVRTPAYAAACLAMTWEVQMAVAGARAAGAQDIVVVDSHWHDTNLLDADFDVPVRRGSQAAIQAMAGASGVIMVGWHAKAGAAHACLPHTYTDRIAHLFIDGIELGELGMLGKLAAHQGVAVLLVSGDRAAREEAIQDLGVARALATKHMGAHTTTYLPRQDIWKDLVAQAYAAVREAGQQRPRARLPFAPGVFEVEVWPGYEVEGDAEAQQVGPRTYRIQGGSILESYAKFQRWVDRLPTWRPAGFLM
jgi:D-amino peptidase